MMEFISTIVNITPPFNMIMIVVVVGCVTGVITTLLKEARKYACHRHDVELKRDLVERGLSVEEIERIVKAGQDKRPNSAEV